MEPNQATYHPAPAKKPPADVGRAVGLLVISPVLFLIAYAALSAGGDDGDGATVLAPVVAIVLLALILPATKRRR